MAFQDLLVNLLDALEDAGRRTAAELIGGDPEADVLVAVLFAEVVGQLLKARLVRHEVLDGDGPLFRPLLRRHFHSEDENLLCFIRPELKKASATYIGALRTQ